MTTKIIHTGDTHLGKTQYGSKIRADDFARAFDVVADIAIDEDADAVIHTGDLFDDRTPDTRSISDAFDTIRRLSEEDIDFYGIVGNHERKWDEQWLDIIQMLDNVYHLDTTAKVVNDEVSLYGYDAIRESEWETEAFNTEDPQDGTVVCVCMHELFTELVPPPKADRSLSEVIERLNVQPDIMPLGDYHGISESEVSGVDAFYSGATERTSATDKDPTVRIIEIEDGSVERNGTRLIKGNRENVPRPFITVSIDLTDTTTRSDIRRQINEQSDNHSESVVVVNLDGSLDSAIKPSQVYEILGNLNVEVPYVSDRRSPDIPNVNNTDATDPTSVDIEKMISEEIGDDVVKEVQKVDREVVRDLTVNKSDIRDIVDKQFNNSQGDTDEN